MVIENRKELTAANNQTAQSIKNIFEQKNQFSTTILKQVSSKMLPASELSRLTQIDYASYKNNINTFLSDFGSLDRDIISITIVSETAPDSYDTYIYKNTYNSDDIPFYSTITNPENLKFIYKYPDEDKYGIEVITSLENPPPDSDSFTITANIRDKSEITDKIGVIYIRFSKNTLNEVCKSNSSLSKNYVLMLFNDSGKVFFDSSDVYTNKKYPYTDKLFSEQPYTKLSKTAR